MRCGSCEKMVSFDTEVEPELTNDPEVKETTFTVEVRRVLTCADCGDELKETSFELEHDFALEIKEMEKPLENHKHEWLVASTLPEATMEGGGRYKKSYYGVSLDVEMECETEGCEASADFTVADKCAASAMDEMG